MERDGRAVELSCIASARRARDIPYLLRRRYRCGVCGLTVVTLERMGFEVLRRALGLPPRPRRKSEQEQEERPREGDQDEGQREGDPEAP